MKIGDVSEYRFSVLTTDYTDYTDSKEYTEYTDFHGFFGFSQIPPQLCRKSAQIRKISVPKGSLWDHPRPITHL